MEKIKITCKGKSYNIKRGVITYVLSKLCGNDFSKADDATLLKTMESYHLIDEITLKSMAEYKN